MSRMRMRAIGGFALALILPIHAQDFGKLGQNGVPSTQSDDPRLPESTAHWSLKWHWKSSLGHISPLIKNGTDDTAEVYGSNWHARFADAQNTLQWLDLPAFLSSTFAARYGHHLSLLMEIPLRRDLRAWQDDPSHLSGTLNPEELDLNPPYEGWIDWNQPGFQVRLGRQRLDQDAFDARSPVFSTRSPLDALHAQIGPQSFVFSYSLISLNPWLLGSQDSNTGEWAMQKRAVADNQHGRIYDDPVRNLLRHRVLWKPGSFHLGMQELAMVGGRSLQMRDALPLHFWHNNFLDGQVNSMFSFELGWLPSSGPRAWGEWGIDEIQAGKDEFGGNPGAFAWNLGLGWVEIGPRLDWRIQVQTVHTDETWGMHRLPLLRMSDRRVLKSNSRDRMQTAFADTYIADIPLGYERGPGAQDLWFDAEIHERTIGLKSLIRVGFLEHSGGLLREDPDQWTNLSEASTWWEIQSEYVWNSLTFQAGLRWIEGDRYQSGFDLGIIWDWNHTFNSKPPTPKVSGP